MLSLYNVTLHMFSRLPTGVLFPGEEYLSIPSTPEFPGVLCVGLSPHAHPAPNFSMSVVPISTAMLVKLYGHRF